MRLERRWLRPGVAASLCLCACGNGGGGGARSDAGFDATLGNGARPDVGAPVDTGERVDLGTGADGFSTWREGTPFPPREQLVTAFHVILDLSYFNAATRVEGVSNGRQGGVSYYFNLADALGRFVYRSREGCTFDDFRVFKVATQGESSGPIAVSAAGAADLDVSLTNPSDMRLAALTEGDLPPGATGGCRALDDTGFEFEGIALVRHLTVGARVLRTAARCEVFCTAQGDASPACRTTCLEAPLPFTGEVTFDLDPALALTATRPPGAALRYRIQDTILDGMASIVLR